MSDDTFILLSILLAVVVIAVLAVALILVRRSLTAISEGLATLSDALEGVEAEHLRPLEPAVKAINAQFDVILARAARHRPQGRDRGRQETAVTVVWIVDAVLILVVLPVVVYLLSGVLKAARSIAPPVEQIATTAAAGSKDLDAAMLLLTTQDQVERTVAGVANYGGSLDVIVDDAEEQR